MIVPTSGRQVESESESGRTYRQESACESIVHDSLGTRQRISTDDHLLISLSSSSPGQGTYEAGGIGDSEKGSDEIDLLENSESFLHFETGSKVFHPGHKAR